MSRCRALPLLAFLSAGISLLALNLSILHAGDDVARKAVKVDGDAWDNPNFGVKVVKPKAPEWRFWKEEEYEEVFGRGEHEALACALARFASKDADPIKDQPRFVFQVVAFPLGEKNSVDMDTLGVKGFAKEILKIWEKKEYKDIKNLKEPAKVSYPTACF